MLLDIIRLLFPPDEPAKQSYEDDILLYLGRPGSIENRTLTFAAVAHSPVAGRG